MNIDKPVAILLQGPSVSELEDKIHLFKDKDWIWASLNRFQMMEEYILSKIGKEFDIVYSSNDGRFDQELESIRNFISKEGNLFITSKDKVDQHSGIFDGCSAYIDSMGEEFITEISDSTRSPNSLTCLLFSLGRLGAKDIYLFGCDGVSREGKFYYHQERYPESKNLAPPQSPNEVQHSLVYDTLHMNLYFWSNWDSVMPYRPRIINVNPESTVNCFEKCSYEEVVDVVSSVTI